MGCNTDSVLEVKDLRVRFGSLEALRGLSLSVERGRVHSIIGPNGCGKTTLIRAISRNLRPAAGIVYLNGADIHKLSAKAIARQMAVLAQTHNGSSDATVRELVTFGRFAHRDWWQGKADDDDTIVEWALERSGMTGFAAQRINTLSGGERQRAWMAMAIAQKPQILLLDEPTTFLDISHQMEVLELISELNKREHMTILMVLHDINQAVRFADELIVMNQGDIYARGQPHQVLTPEVMRDVFRVEGTVLTDEHTGRPFFHARSVVR